MSNQITESISSVAQAIANAFDETNSNIAKLAADIKTSTPDNTNILAAIKEMLDQHNNHILATLASSEARMAKLFADQFALLLDGTAPEVVVPTPEVPPTKPAPTEPELAEPAPEYQPDPVAFTAKINDFNGAPDFSKGVWVGTPAAVRVSVPVSATSPQAFAVGQKVKLADGVVRKVTMLQTIGQNHSITMDGPALNPDIVGHPNVLATESAIVEAPVEVTPPSVPVTSGPGMVYLNLGLGMGGDGPAGGLPGKHGQHYRFPQLDEWKLAASQGFKRARVGFLWERAIRGGAGSGNLDAAHMQLMHQTAAFAKQVGMTIMWDMHNYSGYSTTNSSSGRKRIGSPEVPIQALGNDWKVIAGALMSNPVTAEVTHSFDIMNEPIISWEIWKPALQHAVNQIASVAPHKVCSCEGIRYSNTTNWVTNNPGMETITHPNGKEYLEFQGHLYLDNGQDGFWTDAVETKGIVDVNVGINRIKSFLEWGKKHGLKLSIGETMVPGRYPQYVAALDKFLAHNVATGIDTYVFFAAAGAGNNDHNINKAENKPTLDVILKYSKK